MNPRLMGRPARTAAVVGAVAATGAVTLMAIVSGTAAAAPGATTPGRCTDNVNVRAEPSLTSDIVAVCERGQAVQIGETRNGFVHLVDLDGWSAQEYVAKNGQTPVAKPRTAPKATHTTTTTANGAPRTTPATGHGAQTGPAAPTTTTTQPAPPSAPAADAPADAPAAEPTPAPSGGLTHLLG